jgi:hypothetical protein
MGQGVAKFTDASRGGPLRVDRVGSRMSRDVFGCLPIDPKAAAAKGAI